MTRQGRMRLGSRLMRSSVMLVMVVAGLTAWAPAAAASGPTMIPIAPTPAGIDKYSFGVVGVLGTTMLFGADVADGKGEELWKTDGTAGGTQFVKQLNPGAHGSSPFGPSFRLDGSLYFDATDDVNGLQLWKSDGTKTGTKIVKVIGPPGVGSSASPWTVMGGDLYFSANDGTDPGEHGTELWKTDGTLNGTKRVADLNPGTDSSSANRALSIGSKILFYANDGSGSDLQLFVSDGTAAHTHLVKVINEEGGIIAYPGAGFPSVVMNGIYYFGADDGTSGDAGDHGSELWRSDGTAAGTRLVKDINPGIASSSIGSIRRVGNRLFFEAEDAKGLELWVSDGTTSGTKRVKDIWPGPTGSQPIGVGSIGSTYYFEADDGTHGTELWKSDGTKAGTRMVRDINLAGDSNPSQGVVIGNRMYFSAQTSSKGYELWRTDGTKAGTKLVADLRPGPDSSNPLGLRRVGSKLVFFANDGVDGIQPWTYTP